MEFREGVVVVEEGCSTSSEFLVLSQVGNTMATRSWVGAELVLREEVHTHSHTHVHARTHARTPIIAVRTSEGQNLPR